MEYKLKSAKLQDIVTKTEQLFAKAADLGTISSGNLLIPFADIKPGLVAADILVAKNLTEAEDLTPSISGENLVLTKTTEDVVAAAVIQLVIKL